MGIAVRIIELGESKINQNSSLIGSQDDIAGFNVTMHHSRVAAMQFLQNGHNRKQPVENFLLTTRSASSLDQLEQCLPLNQLHDEVEASISFKGVIYLGKMPALDREEDCSLHQGLPARGRSNVVGFFDGTRPITFAGVDTTVDSTETTSIDEHIDDIVPTDRCPRIQR